ncbi:MAG: hypothetical protein KKD18_00895 [Nanoarchaeota archaeon]|nr:hypothetical protein [Nanoarchaeota archaeon]
MEKKEVAAVILIIAVLATVLIVSGVFYFSMVFSDVGLAGNVVRADNSRGQDSPVVEDSGNPNG